MHPMKTILVPMMAILLSCQSRTDEIPVERPIPVRIAAVERKKISQPIHTGGRLASPSEMKLSFKIGGIIDRIHVDEGRGVKKGQVLAILKLDEIRAQAALAKAGFEKAERDFQRVKNLHADNVATLEQLQDAETGMNAARAQLDIAEFNLEHAVITAPGDGRILRRLAEENELIAAGHPVFMLGVTDKDWVVRVGVTDRDIIRVSVGDSARVRFDAYPGVSFPAVVGETAGAPDPMNGTFEVELTIKRSGRRLISGMIAKTEIYPRATDTYSVVPFESLIEADGSRAYVFIPSSDGTVRKNIVDIAFLTGTLAVVKSGLGESQSVVTQGAAYLRDGMRIEIISEME